jgi:hypothetical protein
MVVDHHSADHQIARRILAMAQAWKYKTNYQEEQLGPFQLKEHQSGTQCVPSIGWIMNEREPHHVRQGASSTA